MEAYLPLQTATIAFEVGKGLIKRDQSDKYKRHFVKKVVKTLEKNCVNVCNPHKDE